MLSEDGPDEKTVFYVLSVDRRELVLKEFQKHSVLRGSDIAKNINRSLQNIGRALDDLEQEGLVKCINPENHTWKKYILTEKGKHILDELQARKLT